MNTWPTITNPAAADTATPRLLPPATHPITEFLVATIIQELTSRTASFVSDEPQCISLLLSLDTSVVVAVVRAELGNFSKRTPRVSTTAVRGAASLQASSSPQGGAFATRFPVGAAGAAQVELRAAAGVEAKQRCGGPEAVGDALRGRAWPTCYVPWTAANGHRLGATSQSFLHCRHGRRNGAT